MAKTDPHPIRAALNVGSTLADAESNALTTGSFLTFAGGGNGSDEQYHAFTAEKSFAVSAGMTLNPKLAGWLSNSAPYVAPQSASCSGTMAFEFFPKTL